MTVRVLTCSAVAIVWMPTIEGIGSSGTCKGSHLHWRREVIAGSKPGVVFFSGTPVLGNRFVCLTEGRMR